MIKTTLRHTLAAVTLAGLAALPAAAQTLQRVRGTIESFDGQVLVVHARDGLVRVALPGDVRVNQMRPGTLADIKPGDFVGIVGLGPADNMRAATVSIFPEAARGTGEGHYGWDSLPSSSMTNGTVDAEVASTDGTSLTLTAKGQTYKANVTPKTVIITSAPGTPTMLAPGDWVFLAAGPGQGGTLAAQRVNVGIAGFEPPL